MSPPLRTFVLALAFFASAVWAQEPEITSVRYEYALDEQTDLTLDSNLKDPKLWGMELRQFGSPTMGQIFTIAGELKQVNGKDIYELELKAEGERVGRSVRVTGKPGEKKPLEVTTRNFLYEDAKPVRLRGTFKPIEPAEREKRTKERFEKVDAAFNDLFARTLLEVGKSGEAKLREVQATRIKMRDALALSSVGEEGAKSGLPYWTALYTSTLDNIGFLRSYTGRSATKGLSGSYRSARGASLDLSAVPETGTLTFTISVPQTNPDFTGTITGSGRLTGTRASYKETLGKREEGDPREPAELVFSQRGHIIRVDAKSTGFYADPSASFSGEYYKTVPRK